jgi:sec-independent protein translocase protein TatC
VRLPRRLGHAEHAELVDHLGELRTRLVVTLAAVAVGFSVAYVFHARLLTWLNSALPPEHRRPVTFGIAEPFLTSVKVSFVAGLALSLPIVLWQVWSFLAPAVDGRAQRTVARLVVFATALFAVGIAFGDRIALPAALKFLTTYDRDHYTILIRAQDYYSFAIAVLVAVGLVFELPVFVLALVRLRVLTATKLRRNRRIGIVAMTALAVALPGVDPVTTALEMIPLLVLYEGSIWLAVVFERRWLTVPPIPRASTASAGSPRP